MACLNHEATGNEEGKGGGGYTHVLNPGPWIMYRSIGAELSTTGRPLLHLGRPTEHVSQGLRGCRFFHPSIAVDSSRVDVAFETEMALLPGVPTPVIGETGVITLRFRDSIKDDATPANARPWRGPVYYWGEAGTRYVWPSLTEFPIRNRRDLLSTPEGGLVWFDESDGSSQWFYRYGEVLLQRLPAGNFPAMMLAQEETNRARRKEGYVFEWFRIQHEIGQRYGSFFKNRVR